MPNRERIPTIRYCAFFQSSDENKEKTALIPLQGDNQHFGVKSRLTELNSLDVGIALTGQKFNFGRFIPHMVPLPTGGMCTKWGVSSAP